MSRSIHRIRPPDVAAYTRLGFMVGFFAAMTAVSAIVYAEIRSLAVVAFGVFCGAMFLSMLNRMMAHDRHVILAASVVIIDDPEPEPPLQGTQLNVLTDNGVKWGVFLPDDHWVKLAAATLKNGNSFSRSTCIALGISGAGIKSQIIRGWGEAGSTGQQATVWSDFCHFLRVQGILQPSAERNQPKKLTALGIAEFEKLAAGNRGE